MTELAYADLTTDFTMSSGPETDLIGLNVTINVGADPVWVEASLPLIKWNGGGTAGYMVYKITDETNRQLAWTGVTFGKVGDYLPGSVIAARVPAGAGSHTYKVRASVGDTGVAMRALISAGGPAWLRVRAL